MRVCVSDRDQQTLISTVSGVVYIPCPVLYPVYLSVKCVHVQFNLGMKVGVVTRSIRCCEGRMISENRQLTLLEVMGSWD